MPQALPQVSVKYVLAFINQIYVTDSFSSAKRLFQKQTCKSRICEMRSIDVLQKNWAK
jgi:hypothetical protein